MNKPSINTIKKYLVALHKTKGKYITCDKLSRTIGIYPEIIADTLSYFDPLIKLDDSYDILDIEDKMKDYVKPINKSSSVEKTVINKKEVLKYRSVMEYIYKEHTSAGFVDKDKVLSEHELKLLIKLIKQDLNKINKK